jgi:hypothetical protein
MSTEVLVALIGVGGTILGVILDKGFEIYKSNREYKRDKERRNKEGIFNIIGTRWKCDWYEYENSTEKLFITDSLTFENWDKGNKFVGYGMLTSHSGHSYKYSFDGEITFSRYIVLTYKSEGFPGTNLIGSATLKLSPDSKKMDGFWSGNTSNDVGEEKMIKGRVHCTFDTKI